MSTTNFTNEQAAQIVLEYGRTRFEQITKNLRELRDAELKKALVPPHKHTVGTTSTAGVEDVPPGKVNPRGKNDALKEESSMTEESSHRGEETSGEISPDDLSKEELCKQCGKSHDLSKGCDGMGKAMLKDSKGREKDNGIHPESVMPEDAKSKEISADGSGGTIKKGKVAKANPPMAKPPSGKNMGTHVPVSKPAPTPVVKGVMADIAMRNSPPRPDAPAAPNVTLPTPAQHEDRAAQFASFTPGAGATGHLMGSPGMSTARPRPGIFGRLGKLGKSELAKAVTQPMPALKPAAAGKHTVGGSTAMTAMTPTSPSRTQVVPGAAKFGGPVPQMPTFPGKATVPAATAPGKGQGAIARSPVLSKRPALKPAGAKLATAGAPSKGPGSLPSSAPTQPELTAPGKPSNINR